MRHAPTQKEIEAAVAATDQGLPAPKRRKTTGEAFQEPKTMIPSPSEEKAKAYMEKHGATVKKSVRLTSVFNFYTDKGGAKGGAEWPEGFKFRKHDTDRGIEAVVTEQPEGEAERGVANQDIDQAEEINEDPFLFEPVPVNEAANPEDPGCCVS